ncbi:MAG TPA: hypothetical protein VGQ84_14910 [Gaiellaceae bacterium]|nr:hypothetical protein [Gaiellaceae bacterium]
MGIIAPVLSLTALAFLLGTVAAVGAFAYAIAQGLEFWRDTKGFLAPFGEAMDDFGRRVDGLASHEPAELGRLEESVARLRRSWAELSVLLNALRRVRDQWAGLLAVYPRK